VTKQLIIYVTFTDESDFDYTRRKCIDTVENYLYELADSEKLDGEFTIDWDVADITEEQ
jgi:hypothetical protein